MSKYVSVERHLSLDIGRWRILYSKATHTLLCLEHRYSKEQMEISKKAIFHQTICCYYIWHAYNHFLLNKNMRKGCCVRALHHSDIVMQLIESNDWLEEVINVCVMDPYSPFIRDLPDGPWVFGAAGDRKSKTAERYEKLEKERFDMDVEHYDKVCENSKWALGVVFRERDSIFKKMNYPCYNHVMEVAATLHGIGEATCWIIDNYRIKGAYTEEEKEMNKAVYAAIILVHQNIVCEFKGEVLKYIGNVIFKDLDVSLKYDMGDVVSDIHAAMDANEEFKKDTQIVYDYFISRLVTERCWKEVK